MFQTLYMIETVLLGNLCNLVEADAGVDFDDGKDNGNRIIDFIKVLLRLNAFIWTHISLR